MTTNQTDVEKAVSTLLGMKRDPKEGWAAGRMTRQQLADLAMVNRHDAVVDDAITILLQAAALVAERAGYGRIEREISNFSSTRTLISHEDARIRGY